jgi:hypothetical protein
MIYRLFVGEGHMRWSSILLMIVTGLASFALGFFVHDWLKPGPDFPGIITSITSRSLDQPNEPKNTPNPN